LSGLGDIPRDKALQALVEEYLVKLSTGMPVTEW
jgi:hypothetical protein